MYLECVCVPERLGIYKVRVFQSIKRLVCFSFKYFLQWKENSKGRYCWQKPEVNRIVSHQNYTKSGFAA